jgi:hypothetical protein
MDITIDYWLVQISRNPNKRNSRTRWFIKQVESLISGYRITMLQTKGRNVSGLCSKESNILERMLNLALEGKYE